MTCKEECWSGFSSFLGHLLCQNFKKIFLRVTHKLLWNNHSLSSTDLFLSVPLERRFQSLGFGGQNRATLGSAGLMLLYLGKTIFLYSQPNHWSFTVMYGPYILLIITCFSALLGLLYEYFSIGDFGEKGMGWSRQNFNIPGSFT